MTALGKYLRLEALGSWREDPEASPREVVVSFGRSTLVLTDLGERPLGHWALAGVSITGHDAGATIYAMSPDGAETLAIRDKEMIAAIEAVARPPFTPAAAPPHRRRRLPLVPFLAAAALIGLGYAAPRGIAEAVAGLMPPEQTAEFGDRMLIDLIERHGPPCRGAAGETALARLAERIDPANPPRLRVIPLGTAPVAALPGRSIVLDRGMIESADGPDEVAGWIALALGRDPVAALARNAGTLADLRYLVLGSLHETALARAARASAAPPAAGESERALAALAAAGIDGSAFRRRIEQSLPAPEPDSGQHGELPQGTLAGADWNAMFAICGEPPPY